MDLDVLLHAKFKKLGEAVTDWRQMRDKLKTLADDAKTQLTDRAARADWSGENSKVTRPFIDKTAGEIADMRWQAETIHNILKDTCAELTGYRDQLQFTIAEADWLHLRVRDTGHGSFRVEPKDGADVSQPTIDGFAEDIRQLLSDATESDHSAKETLVALADLSKYGFTDARYKDRDEAAEALKAGEKAARYAEDPEKAGALDAVLKKYRGDALFAERFATRLGPDGTLEFWVAANDPEHGAGADKSLQKHLSETLALASHSDSPAMNRWENSLVKAGTRTVGDEPGGPTGFQVMSNLMRHGDYDDRFLTRYGTALVAEDKRRSGNGERTAWDDAARFPGLNPGGPDSGADPMTGYMKALANNPAAATDFLNGDDRHPAAPGTKGTRDSNFNYLFSDRTWPHEPGPSGELNTGKNYLAQAIAAGATGVPAGEPAPKNLPPHNEGQAHLFENVVETIGKDNTKLTDNGYMSDSFGKMTAHYLPDAYQVISHDKYGDTWKLYPVSGAQAAPDHLDLKRYLVALGQNPEGYAAVELGQKQYATNLMEYHLDPDLARSDRLSQTDDSPREALHRIATQSGEISGMLAQGRQEAVLGEAGEKDDSFTHALAQSKNLVSGAVGTGIGVGASLITSPAGGAAASGAATTASSMVLEEIFQANEDANKEKAGYISGGKWTDSLDDHAGILQKAAILASERHGGRYRDDVADWVADGVSDGYGRAGNDFDKPED
ncbi:DUF6571 family protein [Streptomyces sp. NRRL S-1868]|uniref:DUF6571 family protein n=1 Tax=Streptomyces sp. NRRL S-1868 TaxID=1463892 RepID=UPI0004C81455|nr:DUF6571 family protein [Streptomyces sp. NRRL S-1868]